MQQVGELAFYRLVAVGVAGYVAFGFREGGVLEAVVDGGVDGVARLA